MGAKRRAADRAGRPAMRSPGRPSVGRLEHRQRFWAAIARGVSSEEAAAAAGVSAAVGVRWFGKVAACRRSRWPRRRGGTCRSRSARRSRCCARAGPECGRSRSSSVDRRRRSRGSCVVTPRLAAARLSIARRRRSGMPTGARGAPSQQSSPSTLGLRRYVQDRLSGTVQRPGGIAVGGPEVRWIGRRHGRRADRRWARAWSPEQISNRLRLGFPDDVSMRVSHEAIYQSLYVQGRGALWRELTACLRTGRALRAPRARVRGRGTGFVSDEVMISQRAAEAQDRAVPGHWEGDLILGLGSSAIGTLVERSSRFTMLLHLPPMDGRDGSQGQKRPGDDRSRSRGGP